MILRILNWPWRSILVSSALCVLAFLAGWFLFIRPAESERRAVQTEIEQTQSDLSTVVEPVYQIDKRPSRAAVSLYVQKASASSGVQIDTLLWKGDKLELISKSNPANISLLATRLASSISIANPIQVQGPGVFPTSLSSSFLPRSKLTIETLFSIAES